MKDFDSSSNLPPEQTQNTSNETLDVKSSNVKGSIWITMLALLLALISVLACVYLWFKLQTQEVRTSSLKTWQAELSQSNSVEMITQKMQMTELKTAINTILQNQTKQENVNLMQIHELVHLAAFQLNFEKDVNVALQLLETADEKTRTDPSLAPLHLAFSQDIDALKQTEVVDVPGILSQLNGLSEEVNSLPKTSSQSSQDTQTKPMTQQQEVEDKQPQSFTQKFERFGLSVWHALSDIVVVSKDNQLDTLLTTDQYRSVTMSMQSQISLAQWAVINRNQDVYQTSLSRVNHMLQQYFSSTDAIVQGILKTVTQLQAVSINPPIPNISHSMGALEK